MTMDRTVHVRLDEASARAVQELRALGLNPSALIRAALRRCAADARTMRNESASAIRSEEMETRLIAEAVDPLAAELDEHAAARDEEVWERFLARHRRRGEIPVVRAWRERDEAAG